MHGEGVMWNNFVEDTITMTQYEPGQEPKPAPEAGSSRWSILNAHIRMPMFEQSARIINVFSEGDKCKIGETTTTSFGAPCWDWSICP